MTVVYEGLSIHYNFWKIDVLKFKSLCYTAPLIWKCAITCLVEADHNIGGLNHNFIWISKHSTKVLLNHKPKNAPDWQNRLSIYYNRREVYVTSADSQLSTGSNDPSKPGAQQRVQMLSGQRENGLINCVSRGYQSK